MGTVAFFDLDRTLIDCNSGRLWLIHEWRGGRVSVSTAIWATWWLFRYSLGHGNFEQVFEIAVESIRGLTESEMAGVTERWFAAEVAHRLRPGARDKLDWHREAGHRLVVATSSSLYAAQCAMSAYGLDAAVATTFEVVEGRFTGKVAGMALAHHKLTRVREWADREGVDLADCWFYTDSVTDRALMEAVGHPVAVNPDRPLRALAAEKGWPVVDWGMSGPKGSLTG